MGLVGKAPQHIVFRVNAQSPTTQCLLVITVKPTGRGEREVGGGRDGGREGGMEGKRE